MSSLKKFDYRIKDNRKRNIFLCGIVLLVVTIVGIKLYQSKAEFTGTSSELNLASGNVVIPATHYLKELEKNNKDQLVYDETTDNNLRYIGANPDNYVWFNDELWRIIGVMNNIDDGTGKKESRIKLIRNESLGEFQWDGKQPNVGSSTNEYGSNDWSDSQLMMMLNPVDVIKKDWEIQNSKLKYTISSDNEKIVSDGTTIFYKGVGSYYNRTTGYNPAIAKIENFTEEEVDFSNSGLSEASKKYIGEAKYYLGGMTYSEYMEATTKEWYTEERGTKVYNSNGVTRPTTWIGYIGLMYPSDYGYATSGGEETRRDICLTKNLYNWGKNYVSSDGSENPDCRNNDWLWDSSRGQSEWLISPNSGDNYSVTDLFAGGGIGSWYAYKEEFNVRPVLYLKSSVKIVDGDGSKDNPFKLAI